jgi:hypothetical protein
VVLELELEPVVELDEELELEEELESDDEDFDSVAAGFDSVVAGVLEEDEDSDLSVLELLDDFAA